MEVETSQILAAVGAVGAAIAAVVVPLVTALVRSKRDSRKWRREREDEITALTSRFSTLENIVATKPDSDSVRDNISLAAEKLGDRLEKTIERVQRECHAELDKHVKEDSIKHREMFDQGREAIEKIGTLTGTVNAVLMGRQQQA